MYGLLNFKPSKLVKQGLARQARQPASGFWKDIFLVDIPQHLIPFGQEACPDWALKRKVTERSAHGDTMPWTCDSV